MTQLLKTKLKWYNILPSNTKQYLRQLLCKKRAQVPLEVQQKKAKQLIPVLETCPPFLNSQHLAVYWPAKGEISPLPLVLWAYSMGKQCYLPVLDPVKPRQLHFVEYKPTDPLIPNRFGILEPILKNKKTLPAWDLDLIFTPLVAFDHTGRRLGTGGGYYDQTLSFLKTELRPKKPILLGLAYDWQYKEDLPEDLWDIALNGIITNERYIAID